MSAPFKLEIKGYCPICQQETVYTANHHWLRGSLECKSCPGTSVPRERALALEREAPNWRKLAIHESSPAGRGISLIMREQCARYTGTHFYPAEALGASVPLPHSNGKIAFRNENIEQQTFKDENFDLVVTLDVFEHVFHPDRMIAEIHRTLRPGGLYISTFPIRKYQVEAIKPRARLLENGEIEYLAEPEYHGNPIDQKGSLVTYDYGYDIHQKIAEWADFDVEILRFADRRAGVLGEYTDVIVCRKPGNQVDLRTAPAASPAQPSPAAPNSAAPAMPANEQPSFRTGFR